MRQVVRVTLPQVPLESTQTPTLVQTPIAETVETLSDTNKDGEGTTLVVLFVFVTPMEQISVEGG